MDIVGQPLHRLREEIACRKVSARELTDAFLARIDSVEGTIRAYNTLTRKEGSRPIVIQNLSHTQVIRP